MMRTAPNSKTTAPPSSAPSRMSTPRGRSQWAPKKLALTECRFSMTNTRTTTRSTKPTPSATHRVPARVDGTGRVPCPRPVPFSPSDLLIASHHSHRDLYPFGGSGGAWPGSGAGPGAGHYSARVDSAVNCDPSRPASGHRAGTPQALEGYSGADTPLCASGRRTSPATRTTPALRGNGSPAGGGGCSARSTVGPCGKPQPSQTLGHDPEPVQGRVDPMPEVGSAEMAMGI